LCKFRAIARNFCVIFGKDRLQSTDQSLGDLTVLTTIVIGTCVSVQGFFVRRQLNGLVTVRVDDRLYTGRPINGAVAA